MNILTSMPFITFETFFETTAADPSAAKIANEPGAGNSSHIRTRRIAGGPNATGLRTGTINNPGATNTVPKSGINTDTPLQIAAHEVEQNPAKEKILGAMEMPEIQKTYGINPDTMEFGIGYKLNSKMPVELLKSVDPTTGKPVYKLMHKPIQ